MTVSPAARPDPAPAPTQHPPEGGVAELRAFFLAQGVEPSAVDAIDLCGSLIADAPLLQPATRTPHHHHHHHNAPSFTPTTTAARAHRRMHFVAPLGVPLQTGPDQRPLRDRRGGAVSCRRDCHLADIPSPSLLKRLLKGRGGCSRMTTSPTARRCQSTSWPPSTPVLAATAETSPCHAVRRPTYLSTPRGGVRSITLRCFSPRQDLSLCNS